MLDTQCISITDLRTNTKKCLEGLSNDPKYVFINNKPIAVILDIKSYENIISNIDFRELDFSELDDDLLLEAKKVKSLKKSDLINI